ncbi:MAG: hypothetical protein SO314_01670 [Alphaproteobacteria bacterium]|nr:hypothetical protein [Alphaproteobacteria bacterium]
MLSRKYRKHWRKNFRTYCNQELDRIMTERGLTSAELSNHIDFLEGRIEKLRRNTESLRMGEYAYLFSFFDKVFEIKLSDTQTSPWQ